MNRYITEGIIHDLTDGKTLAIHANPVEAKQVFQEVLATFPAGTISGVNRANGQQSITLHNGARLRLIHPSDSLRGHNPNVLITDALYDMNTLTDLRARDIEIIRR